MSVNSFVAVECYRKVTANEVKTCASPKTFLYLKSVTGTYNYISLYESLKQYVLNINFKNVFNTDVSIQLVQFLNRPEWETQAFSSLLSN